MVLTTLKLESIIAVTSSFLSSEQSVQEQANYVRQLKETDQLTKGDPVLDEAIAELLNRKEELQSLQ